MLSKEEAILCKASTQLALMTKLLSSITAPAMMRQCPALQKFLMSSKWELSVSKTYLLMTQANASVISEVSFQKKIKSL